MGKEDTQFRVESTEEIFIRNIKRERFYWHGHSYGINRSEEDMLLKQIELQEEIKTLYWQCLVKLNLCLPYDKDFPDTYQGNSQAQTEVYG